jgi:hypothetical protein
VTTAVSTTWTEYTALFKTADTHLKTDTFRVLVVEFNNGGAGSTIDQFVDDVTVDPAEPCLEGETCDELNNECVEADSTLGPQEPPEPPGRRTTGRSERRDGDR